MNFSLTINQLWQEFDPQIWTDYEYRQKMVQMYGANDALVKDIFTVNKSF